MKNVFIILAVICLPVFLSLSKTDGDKFTGTWKAVDKNSTINDLVITKTGTMYHLTYNTATPGQGGAQRKTTLMYIYKDGLLTSAGAPDFGAAKLTVPSGHLMWNGEEWEKTADKTE